VRRRGRGERTPLNAEINVVSLIDVMMLLMVIFMITAPIMQGGVDVNLPKAAAKPLESKGGMVVSVTKDGKIYVDDLELTLASFRSSFKSLASQKGKEGIYLRGDADARYGVIVQVFSIMKNSGVPNIGIIAEPESVVK
jgi:biopolymer transport protein ExbD/biopolymer transport protein TolR